MVRAAVSEAQLAGLVPRCEPEQLVAEADAEHRHASEQLAQDGDLVHQWFRVARPVRQHHAVERRELVGGHVVRKDRHSGSAPASRRRIERLQP